ncbi:MAG: hypothetical protein ACFCU8_02945, partial [Thermosynechococcaceae cyanobacterium]
CSSVALWLGFPLAIANGEGKDNTEEGYTPHCFVDPWTITAEANLRNVGHRAIFCVIIYSQQQCLYIK